MRLDKFLKVSRLIKRRTVAAEACANGRVSVNGRIAKQSADVKEGDIIEIAFGSCMTRIKVINISVQANKENAREMYEITE
ncbi:MAG: RNA-binding S4 domain-containing protein [Clostridia bacterium]|nr:RNA-binding S4 domain-containing protein [Clostridia bacterium]